MRPPCVSIYPSINFNWHFQLILNLFCIHSIFGKIAPNNYDGHPHHLHLEHDPTQQPRHLLDDSVLEHSDALSTADLTSLESAEGIMCDFAGSDCDLMSPEAAAAMQGCVRRKTVQKEGRKPAVASWQRYWLQIWANNLVYFPPKSFKGSERGDFKREPCKVCPLDGWYAHVSDNTKHKNTFELYHRTGGTVYKFRTDSPQMTHLWTNAICKLATTRVPKPLPANLMSFEWIIHSGKTNCKRDTTPGTDTPWIWCTQ